MSKAILIALLGLFGVSAISAPGRAGYEALSQATPAARKTVEAQTAGGLIEKVTRTLKNGEPTYEVDWSKGPVERSCTVAEDGTLLGRLVFLNEVPAPVRTRIQSQVGKARLGDIFWTDEAGEIAYEVETKRNGKSQFFNVASNGNLISVQVNLAETPEPVRKTIQARMGGGTSGDIYRAIEEEEVVYFVDMAKNGKGHSFTVSTNGEILSTSLDLTETPITVQKAIKQQIGTGRLGEIEQTEKGKEVTYEVKGFWNGHRRSLSVAPNGQINSVQVALDETPAAVQKKIQERAGFGTILRIDRTTQGDNVDYDVEVKTDGKRVDFTVGADGKVYETKQ